MIKLYERVMYNLQRKTYRKEQKHTGNNARYTSAIENV